MRVFHQLEEVSSRTGATAVAIGNFDGIHLGHQSLLRSMMNEAKSQDITPTVLTFFPHPVEVLQPQKKLQRLTTGSEKLSLLESFGVEQVLVAPFDMELAALTPDQFFEKFLIKGLKCRSLHVGFNFNFGKNRSGNIDTLKLLAAQAGIKLQVQPEIQLEGEKVSSTAIRKYLAEGNIDKTNLLLARPYRVAGQVTKGDGRGRKIGFPTANIHCPADKLFPANGVYVTRVHWQKQQFQAVTNVGTRPTFEGQTQPATTVEAHLLDFDAQIYDEFLDIDFLHHLRPELRFSGVEALCAQIQKDITLARSLFKSPSS